MTLFQPLRPGFSILIVFTHFILTILREMFPFQDTQFLRYFLDIMTFYGSGLILIMPDQPNLKAGVGNSNIYITVASFLYC